MSNPRDAYYRCKHCHEILFSLPHVKTHIVSKHGVMSKTKGYKKHIEILPSYTLPNPMAPPFMPQQFFPTPQIMMPMHPLLPGCPPTGFGMIAGPYNPAFHPSATRLGISQGISADDRSTHTVRVRQKWASNYPARSIDCLTTAEQDLAELMSTPEGLHELLHGSENFGIFVGQESLSSMAGGVSQTKAKPCVDFGLRFFDDLDIEGGVPLGYEEGCFENKKFSISVPIDIGIFCDDMTESVSICNIFLCPNDPLGPTVDILDDTGESLVGKKLSSGPRFSTSTTRIVSLTFSESYRGYVKGLLFLKFQVFKKISRTTRATFVSTSALPIRGGILSDASKPLSSEARPFVPKHLKLIFESQAHLLYSVLTLSRTLLDDTWAPRGFASKIARVYNSFKPSEAFETCYLKYLSSSQVDRNSLLSSSGALDIVFPDTSNVEDCSRYLKSLGHLLYCEELQMREDIKHFDLYDIPLACQTHPSSRDKVFVSFIVKGSNESRPALFRGDCVRVRPSSVTNDIQSTVEIVGVVKTFTLRTEEVVCEFPAACLDSSLLYHVRFTFERSGIAFIRQSLDIVAKTDYLQNCIFPSSNSILMEKIKYLKSRPLDVDEPSCTALESILLDSPDCSRVCLNSEQRLATKSIVYLYEEGRKSSSSGTSFVYPPFVIFGPPGTGKTLTITAAILELHRVNPECRILVSAPSDAAADVLCLRLQKHYEPKLLFRLNWWQRTTAAAFKVLNYSYKNEFDVFDIPPREAFMQFRIVVSTCSVAGNLIHDSTCDPFDVVIIDEVSQAIEAEALVPVSLCKSGGCIVIAGDSEQLGANPRSPVYLHSLTMGSLQDRLLRTELYGNLKGQDMFESPNFRFGTFLRRNYRSHHDIFSVSSNMFYGNSLVESADSDVIYSLLDWSPPRRYQRSTSTELRTLPSAVHFVAIDGQHAHEVDSPSFYNLFEIEAVVDICLSLVSTRGVRPEEIGIIAAFRSQVLKLRAALRSAGLSNVNVGSVLDLQGQEVKVIVISTVLTSRLQSDRGEVIGLLGDHRKFNVAVTRGMALCIVVGEPSTLYEDTHWASYIELCDRKGTFHGSDCHRLQRFVKVKDLVEADDLLADAARLATQNSDVGDILGSGNMSSSFSSQQYYADDLIWNTFLQR